MTKLNFILTLHNKLAALPQAEVEERLTFYTEMIEDRMEDGLSEEEAVAAVGSIEEIAAQITADIPLAKIAKERMRPKRKFKTWEILLLVLGAPLWVPLLIAAFAVVLSVYLSWWSVIVSLWAVFGALVGSAFGSIIGGAAIAVSGNGASGTVLLAGGLVCAGLSIFMFFGCKAATKGTVMLTKKFVLWIKNCFVKKEDVQ